VKYLLKGSAENTVRNPEEEPEDKHVTITTEVVACTSFRVGVTTFFISARTSFRK